jgi:hypothetical protein
MKLGKILGMTFFVASIFVNNNSFAGEKEFLCSNPAARVSCISNILNHRICC